MVSTELTVAYPGREGAHSAAACDRLFPAARLVPVAAFSDVIDAVASGRVPYGVLPIESSLVGPVAETHDLLYQSPLSIVAEAILPVNHCLVGPADVALSDVREIHSLRTALEIFAFEQIWDRRDDRFHAGLVRRNEALIATIDAGDDRASILTELAFHGFVYEACGHRLLERAWHGLRGRLQLYWAAHHRAHGRRGPKRDSHDGYIAAALGDDLATMRNELADHMRRGAAITEHFLHTVQPNLSGKSKRGDKS